MSIINDPYNRAALESSGLRQKVRRLAENDLVKAYDLAKTIKHPWYRCQALAMVAETVELLKLKTILQQSFESAMQCHDENRRVLVACWPLEVAIKREEPVLATSFLAECEKQINSDNDIISRWCCTSVVHVIKTDIALLNSFFETFSYATSKGHGWRVERSIRSLIGDPAVQKDQRYIDHLLLRQTEIEKWKKENRNQNS